MVGWFLLLAVVCIALVAVYFILLPKYFLKTRYRIAQPTGRGLRVVRDEKGKNIIYEPERKLEPYIKSYILSEKNGKKSLICKIDEELRYLDYDIVLFNGESECFKGLRIRETVERAGHTRAVDLPTETCYVSLVLNAADGTRVENGAVRRLDKGRLSAFIVLCILLETAGFFVMRICLTHTFGGLFAESFLTYVSGWREYALCGAVVVVLNFLLAMIAVKTERKRQGRSRGES